MLKNYNDILYSRYNFSTNKILIEGNRTPSLVHFRAVMS